MHLFGMYNSYCPQSPGQMIATFQCNLTQHCRVQHVACIWPPFCDMLQRVGCCWLKYENGQIFHATCGCCMMQSFGQVRATILMLCLGMCTSSIFNWQHVATRCNRVTKCGQHVAIVWLEHANSRPTMLGYVALRCCYRLARA